MQGAGHAPVSGLPLAYHYPVVGGTIPGARWAHASAAVGSRMFVYGGVGQAVLDDLAVLDTELMVWRLLSPTAPRPKDRPEKCALAAMCAMGSMLWLFGGQQGRKHLRTLYSLNTELMCWKLATPAGACPAGREGHSFTAVQDQAAYLFGGQGKRLYADLFLLRQGGSDWVELKPQGHIPAARSGHSMVWDGRDFLICFGGTTASGTDNQLFVYSISRNEWIVPESSGTIPSPRTQHSAVLLPSKQILVFGGCNAKGVFFNDAYVLNLEEMRWCRAQAVNTPPSPRYHHSCHEVGSKVVLYGGINPKQAFDAVVLLAINFTPDLSAIAQELAQMAGSCSQAAAAAAVQPQPAAAAAAAATGPAGLAKGMPSASSSSAAPAAGSMPLVGDLMKAQLRDLLIKRNMEELHIKAQNKADTVEQQLKEMQADKGALQKEVMQLKLITAETEEANQQLRDQLTQTSKTLLREHSAHKATAAALSEANASLVQCKEQLAEAMQLLQSVTVELSILSSRYHHARQECRALRAARQQQSEQQHLQEGDQAQLQQQGESIQLHQQPEQQQLSWQPSEGPCQQQTQETQQSFRQQQEQQQLQDDTDAVAAASWPLQYHPFASTVAAISRSRTTISLGNTGQAGLSGVNLHGMLDLAVDPQVPLCPHGQLQAACLLCACQTFLATTAGSYRHSAPGSSAAAGPSVAITTAQQPVEGATSAAVVGAAQLADSSGSAAGLVTMAVAACADEAAQYRRLLSMSELSCGKLAAENRQLQHKFSTLQGQCDQQQRHLQAFEGQPAALTAFSLEELSELEDTLEATTKAVRQVVLHRSIIEVQRQADEQSKLCAVCMEAPRRLAFGCGHQTCSACGDKMKACPFCRQPVTSRIHLYE